MSRGAKLSFTLGSSLDTEPLLEKKSTKSTPKTQEKTLLPQKHFLHFSKEKRKAKVVTLVGEFYLSKEDAQTLLKKIKKSLGCGGSYKNGYMEFQGEIKERLKEELRSASFRFKNKH